jgi:hypothetical protein
VLALQENRMLLQTSLLDEQQFFISTGLGGKGKKLRYYLVFINRNRNELLTKTQQKLVKDELIFGLKPEDGNLNPSIFLKDFVHRWFFCRLLPISKRFSAMWWKSATNTGIFWKKT